jgi:glycerol-3-phosphate dehydrogenase
MLTAVPWRGYALVGTSQSQTFAQPGDTGASAAEVATLIADANSAFPALKLTADDIRLVHRGLVPAVKGRNGVPDLRMIPEIYDHASDGAAGAFTIASAKYSSARGVAERAIGMVARQIRKRVSASRTATTVLPGAGIADHEALAIESCRPLGLELSIATIRHLIQRYAERTPDVIALMHAHPPLRQPLGEAEPTLGAEVVYVIRNEMARTLADVVLRRTTFGATGRPPDDALERAGRIAAGELDWDDEHTAREIAAVRDFYLIS